MNYEILEGHIRPDNEGFMVTVLIQNNGLEAYQQEVITLSNHTLQFVAGNGVKLTGQKAKEQFPNIEQNDYLESEKIGYR